MAGDQVDETYDGLWGPLMFIMHESEQLWAVNEGRADWFESLALPSVRTVLDLGCGNGYVDAVLGRRGYEVVGVDRVRAVVEEARSLIADEPVEYLTSDLRDIDFESSRFDVAFMFGVSGLMSVADDQALLSRIARWLRPGGTLLIDGDLELASTETIRVDHTLGTIEWNWTSDTATRTNILTPVLRRSDGVTVRLREPIDTLRGDHEGLHRYIYRPEELSGLVADAGFEVSQIGHYVQHVFPDQRADGFMLRCTLPER